MELVLSIMMLAAGALVAGATYLLRRGSYRKQAWLMIVLAVVMVANVLLWTVPDGDGAAPIDRAATGQP